MIFSLNGVRVPAFRDVFSYAGGGGFFAAASFMSYQQCVFNFGSERFRHPPTDRAFKSFNAHGSLKEEDKVILPR